MLRASFLLFLHHLCCCILLASSSSSPQTASAVTADYCNKDDDWTSTILDRSSKDFDTYISASPLSVAAVCRDGIALVSLHFGLEESISVAQQSAHEKLSSSQKEGDEDLRALFNDLPLTSRGPLRIEPLHDNGASTNSITTSTCSLRSPPSMALLTAGWRTDGMALSDAARELIMEETSLFCLPLSVTMGSNGDASFRKNCQPSYFGRRIADGLSYYMAMCAFSEGVRSLSTIGLLACNNSVGGCLYLVDATGSYRVRAHAIGNGATIIHKRLIFADFEDMGCLEGLRLLLRIIAEESGMLPSPKTKAADTSSKIVFNDVDGKHVVELAILRSCEQRMRRIMISSLFTTADNQEQPGGVIEE